MVFSIYAALPCRISLLPQSSSNCCMIIYLGSLNDQSACSRWLPKAHAVPHCVHSNHAGVARRTTSIHREAISYSKGINNKYNECSLKTLQLIMSQG